MPLLDTVGHRSDVPWCSHRLVPHYGFSSSKQTTGGSVVSNTGGIFSPVFFPRYTTIDRIGLQVTTASTDVGGVLRIVMYADNGFYYPGDVVLDAGTVAADSLGVKEITLSPFRIPEGVVWVGAFWQLQPTSRANVELIAGSPPIGHNANTAVSGKTAGYVEIAGGAVSAAFNNFIIVSTLCPRITWRLSS